MYFSIYLIQYGDTHDWGGGGRRQTWNKDKGQQAKERATGEQGEKEGKNPVEISIKRLFSGERRPVIVPLSQLECELWQPHWGAGILWNTGQGALGIAPRKGENQPRGTGPTACPGVSRARQEFPLNSGPRGLGEKMDTLRNLKIHGTKLSRSLFSIKEK